MAAPAHSTSEAAATELAIPILIQLRDEIGTLVREVKDIKALVRSHLGVELAVPGAPSTKVEAKVEPLEDELRARPEEGLTPAKPDGTQDDRSVQVMREEQGRAGVSDWPGSTQRKAHDTVEQPATVAVRRQSTEEPDWHTPPCEEVLFRLNPEYAQRIARAAIQPAQIPDSPPQPREETPSPPPRSRSPVPVLAPTSQTASIVPASQTKRKHKFELIIDIPAKKHKAVYHPVLNHFSNSSVASSSRAALGDSPSAVEATRAPLKKSQGFLSRVPTVRKVLGTKFKVNLDPKIREVAVTRDFMHTRFGVNRFRSFSQISGPKLQEYGYDHFVCVSRRYDTQLPPAPGQPGLVTLFEEAPWPVYDRYRLFVSLDTGTRTPAKWQYMGLYEATRLPAWSPEEVKCQGYTVKSHWSTTVWEREWAHPVLARIMLRKEFGREPTANEVSSQIGKLRVKSVSLPSLETIAAAFENGEEKLYPWKLECKGYEENLQWEIAIAFPHWHKAGMAEPNGFGASGST